MGEPRACWGGRQEARCGKDDLVMLSPNENITVTLGESLPEAHAGRRPIFKLICIREGTWLAGKGTGYEYRQDWVRLQLRFTMGVKKLS